MEEPASICRLLIHSTAADDDDQGMSPSALTFGAIGAAMKRRQREEAERWLEW